MTYEVRLTERAERDVRESFNWIAERSEAGAESWLSQFEAVLFRLANTPHTCPLARESGHGDTEIRQVVFKTRRGKPYRVLFTVQDNLVFVRHVRGPGQDLVPPSDV